jgi:hypothetical protein
MSTLIKKEKTFLDISPKSMTEAKEFAELFVKSIFCPKYLQNKAADALMIMQTGYEMGLKPMQAFKTLGCINGLPFAYGDGKLALVKQSRHYHSVKEWHEGNIEEGNYVAYCTAKRKNGEENTRSFSMVQAKRAGLLTKGGAWSQYPERMMQHRARIALNDTFPDVLFGLLSEDEAYELAKEIDVTPSKIINKGNEGVKEALGLLKNVESVPAIDSSNQVTEVLVDVPQEENFNTDNSELATDKQITDINNLIIDYGLQGSIDKWLKTANVTSFKEMPKERIQALIDGIVDKVSKR